ncbi:MAG TPA: sulfatase [Polyangiaceae bacterium]|nr:sulfatase [Polyangiaceae bacterium]
MGRLWCTIGLAAALTGACSKEQKPSPADAVGGAPEPATSAVVAPIDAAAPAAKPAAEREALNVLLLTVDSLRSEMPWTGYPRPIAPNLTRLAERSTVYTNAYSASSYTAKSVATLLTGRYASTLYRDGFFFAKYPAANLFLAEILAERGIRSMGWHGHMYFGRGKGLEQGFTEWELVPGITFDSETDKHVTSEKMTTLGLKLLGSPENAKGQFFAWAHYMDPHDQYVKHEQAPEFGNKARDRYDSEVWHTDAWIQKLLDWAQQQPWWSKTAIIVSADHGEAFGEHGMYKHAFELWEVLTRVPLVIYGPGIQAQRIEQRRSHIDIAPTILDLMRVPVPEGFQGQSLVPELLGGAPVSREPILLELAEDSHNPPRRALIAGAYKIIHFGGARYQLFDLQSDPGENKDLAKERPDELARMRKLLDDRYATLPTIAPYGGMKLKEGGTARGPVGPAK